MSTQPNPPANRAERRAAARGRTVPDRTTTTSSSPVPRASTKPARGGASGPRRSG